MMIKAFIYVSIFFGFSQNALSMETPDKSVKELTKQLLENGKTKEDVLRVLNAAKISVESLKVIEADLNKRLPATLKLPPLKIINDQIVVDSKPTAIRIASYSPFKVQIKSKYWEMNEEKNGDENYMSLVEFLSETSESSALIDLILPKAEAGFFGGAVKGGILGMMGGMFLGVATGAPMLQTTVAFGGMGALIGGMMSMNQPRPQPMPMGYPNYSYPYGGNQPMPYYPQPNPYGYPQQMPQPYGSPYGYPQQMPQPYMYPPPQLPYQYPSSGGAY